ncbi:hypothetical protein O3P69_005667 [Scylla paramamosain]|uniref:Uncharacterized protein n=1 Tax=Scylla paramamosain TaxID=85552 RepID=A0AAW0U7K6_SCYPA
MSHITFASLATPHHIMPYPHPGLPVLSHHPCLTHLSLAMPQATPQAGYTPSRPHPKQATPQVSHTPSRLHPQAGHTPSRQHPMQATLPSRPHSKQPTPQAGHTPSRQHPMQATPPGQELTAAFHCDLLRARVTLPLVEGGRVDHTLETTTLPVQTPLQGI